MKKLIYLVAISASTFAFQGCNNSGTKDAKENADSLNMVKDTTSDAMSTGGIAADASDAQFATKAAVGGMAEVELGKLALTKTTDPKVKEFANMMVQDHGKANEELIAIAKTKNITLPTIVDDEHKKKMEDLQKLSGADFDKQYAIAMVDGHESTLKLMQGESKEGKDAELKAFATKTAPIVQTHLTMITNISKSLK
jgi:putative membrane protein